jgi:hypothetical protein
MLKETPQSSKASSKGAFTHVSKESDQSHP